MNFRSAVVEPRVGGRWLERTREGEEISWGDVRAYEPGRRLVLGFAIGADRQPVSREKASEVEVRFIPAGESTRVEVEHRNFERHEEGAELLR
ncbi:MAG TPA: SRPBCC domain-containing protein [Polyangiaceae bacterium]|nr:SRPBCC domain-containing protein [Polyangiaceae bacterium]